MSIDQEFEGKPTQKMWNEAEQYFLETQDEVKKSSRKRSAFATVLYIIGGIVGGSTYVALNTSCETLTIDDVMKEADKKYATKGNVLTKQDLDKHKQEVIDLLGGSSTRNANSTYWIDTLEDGSKQLGVKDLKSGRIDLYKIGADGKLEELAVTIPNDRDKTRTFVAPQTATQTQTVSQTQTAKEELTSEQKNTYKETLEFAADVAEEHVFKKLGKNAISDKFKKGSYPSYSENKIGKYTARTVTAYWETGLSGIVKLTATLYEDAKGNAVGLIASETRTYGSVSTTEVFIDDCPAVEDTKNKGKYIGSESGHKYTSIKQQFDQIEKQMKKAPGNVTGVSK